MARYFTMASTRGGAISKMMEMAANNPGDMYTVYYAMGTQPPIYLVGIFTPFTSEAGMLPVISFLHHAPSCLDGGRVVDESMAVWADLEGS